jgi:lipopolysaccharide/colanic/teichoic acid biosynthesis glycosyltransferase
MKNIHQNVHQCIKKNKLSSFRFATGQKTNHFNVYYDYQASPKSLIYIYVYKQISLLVNFKEKSQRERIIERIGNEAFSYIEHFIDTNSEKTQLLFYAKDQVAKKGVYDDIVSLKALNSITKLDSYLIKVNHSLEDSGKFIGFVKTNKQRKESQRLGKVPVLGKMSVFGEFVFHRIFPKIGGLKHLYFGLTRGKHQRLSKAGVLGRLIKFGFKIIELEEDINGVMYFVVKKVKKPDVKSRASNGFIYKFPRVGQYGKLISVYKIRTMHAYSEYLQDYIVNTNGYGINGKPSNDFRVPSWAKFVRRYWLDELPQLINVLKGEMKLFGVRPVTDRYFQDIPKHIQKLRFSQKPGCIPPYLAYNKDSSKESVLMAEEDYLKLNKKGFFVDLKFIAFAIKNIVFNNKRGS